MASLGVPTTVAGRYVTGELLGRGGMGEVYDAVDLRLDRPVALKRLRGDLADDLAMRRRVETEARLAARLAHPNVVTVFDSGLEDGHPFIVMERLEGRTLRDELADGPMDPDAVRSMARQVLDALEAAHAIGLIHRDVKPGNILVAGAGTWKVADFGIATSTEGEHTITRTGELLGSPSYLAPERLEGHAATTRSDLYSLGVVLYEALSGEPPFGEGEAIALAIRIRDGRHVPLIEAVPDLDPGLAAAVERAMRKDPMSRFATAEEMAAAIEPGAVSSGGPADTTVVIERPSESTAVLEVVPPAEPIVEDAAPVAEARPVVDEAPPAVAQPRSPRVAPSSGRSRTAVMFGIAAAVVIAIAVVLALTLGGGSAPTVPTQGTTSGTPVPAPLQDALDRLQESIRA
jgi:serine/threonine-protein kinase